MKPVNLTISPLKTTPIDIIIDDLKLMYNQPMYNPFNLNQILFRCDTFAEVNKGNGYLLIN